MNSNANDRYGPSLERTLGAGKPVDPATRLSELLAQSLEELTRPFEAPRTGSHSVRPVAHSEAAPASRPTTLRRARTIASRRPRRRLPAKRPRRPRCRLMT